SVDAFVGRRAGREAAEVLADALVTGIYAGDPALLSVRAAFPRLVELEDRFGSILKGLSKTARQRRTEARARGEPYQRPRKMWSFQQGLRLLIESLANQLPSPPLLGVHARYLHKIAPANRTEPQWLIVGEGQDRWP